MTEKEQNEILDQELSMDELDAINGGAHAEGAGGDAGCSSVYYLGACTATVEKGSHCWKDDFCMVISSTYHIGPGVMVQDGNSSSSCS